MDECVLCHKNFDGVAGLEYPVCFRCASKAAMAYKRAGTKSLATDGWFLWTVEIAVREVWVADGFELTEERAHGIMAKELGWANGETEIACRLVDAPDQKRIRVAQGYEKESA